MIKAGGRNGVLGMLSAMPIHLSRYGLPRLAAAALTLASCVHAVAEPLPVATWQMRVQTLGAKYRKGDTDAATQLARDQMIEAFTKQWQEPATLQVTATIRNVRWKDGVAEVYTERELGPHKTTPQTPITLSRGTPFQMRMTQEEAGAIKAGATMRFEGTLAFHPRRYGAVGAATKSQQLYTLRHHYLATYIGTFTSSDCTFTIGGRKYQSRWAGE